jgi:hypothetical protein
VIRAKFSDVPRPLLDSELIITTIRNRNKTTKASFVLPTATLFSYTSSDARCCLMAISKAHVADKARMEEWFLHQFIVPKTPTLLLVSHETALDRTQVEAHANLEEHAGSEEGKTSISYSSDHVPPASKEWLSDLQTYYNVLLIEIDPKTNIATRKALGMIKKDEWDALGAETETIKLG